MIIHTDSFVKPYKVYWHIAPETQVNFENFIIESDQSKIEFEFEYDENQRKYFVLKFADGRTIVTGHRILQIPGMYNFRDLGGFPTIDNKKVKWGLLYRGDHLHNLKLEGFEFVENLNIKTIIDFRSETEILESPNPIIKTVEKTYNFSPEATVAMFAGVLQNGGDIPSMESMIDFAKTAVKNNPKAAYIAMLNQQKQFVTKPKGIEAFSNTLKALINTNGKVSFQHCRGGKDRTGYALMLLLALLGVEEKYLVYDYMLTHKAREKKNQRYLENYRRLADGNEAVAQYLFSFFDVKEDYILMAINKINENYGNVKNYALKVLGISETDIAKLKSYYLE